MDAINSAIADAEHIDLKQATMQIRPVTLDTPALTPFTTPDETSPANEDATAEEKGFLLPDYRARELAAKLTLEEQVRVLWSSTEKAWAPTRLDMWLDDRILRIWLPLKCAHRVILTREFRITGRISYPCPRRGLSIIK